MRHNLTFFNTTNAYVLLCLPTVKMKGHPLYRFFLIGLCLWTASFLLPVLPAAAQGTVYGIVVEKGTPKRVAEATVTNRRTLEKAISNEEGSFTIPAKVGDTLIVTKYAYSSIYYRITDVNNIAIALNPTIELETVTVTGQTRKEELQDVLKDYQKQGIYNNGKPKALSYVFNPVSALYGTFSRSAKNARNFNRYAQNEIKETEVDKKFNKYNVAELTGLKGDDLMNFLTLYRPSYEQSRYWSEYDIQNYVKISFEKFNRDGRPKADTLPRLEIPPQELNNKDQ